MAEERTTMQPSYQVALISDGNPAEPTVESILAMGFSSQTIKLSEALDFEGPLPQVAVFCLARLGGGEAARIGELCQRHAITPVFVFRSYKLQYVDAARELGGENCFVPPYDGGAIVAAVRASLNRAVEAGWSNLKATEERALRSSVVSFDSMLEAASAGEALPLEKVNQACENIQQSLGESNVDRWLGALQKHHNNTYRHSMFVCGVLAFFARSLGIKGDELKELTVGGFLHDAGKAMIPLAILDKPSKLDDEEWQVMRTHPEHSRTILLREHGLSERIVRMAVHHHEKLDGGGYPDGLSAGQLEDPVRLTAIADVYAALAEERAYKPAMPPEKALEIMAGFEGHLDMDLLRVFRQFVLDQTARGEAVAA